MGVDMNIRALVVDDYKTMVRIVRNLLNQLGFQDVDEANDGATALTKLRARRFGLVISDWAMEPMNGQDAGSTSADDHGAGTDHGATTAPGNSSSGTAGHSGH